LNQQVTEEQVRQRYYNVGGVPRDIFYGYETALSEQDSAVAALTEFQATRYLRNLANGVVTMDRERPNARLLGMTSSEETGFRSYVTIPISSGVTTKILEAFPYVVWECFILGDAANAFVRQYAMDFFSTQQTSLTARQCVQGVAAAAAADKKHAVHIGGNMTIVQAKNVVEQAARQSQTIFCTLEDSIQDCCIDFAYSTRCNNGKVHIHAFSVLVAPTPQDIAKGKHKMNQVLKVANSGATAASMYYLCFPWNLATRTDPLYYAHMAAPSTTTTTTTLEEEEANEHISVWFLEIPVPLYIERVQDGRFYCYKVPQPTEEA
jgi:hypothetical protein